MLKIEVIVSRCHRSSQGWAVYGDNIYRGDQEYKNEQEALKAAAQFVQEGQSVVVRPMYNDYFHAGEFQYHEFRSFNGDPFKLVVFNNKEKAA